MNCNCKRLDERLCLVDQACIAEMHRERPPATFGTPDQWVPADSMLNLGIYFVSESQVIFECGCTGRFRSDGEIGWEVWGDCHMRWHPGLAA
jgi:hypothetical protein